MPRCAHATQIWSQPHHGSHVAHALHVERARCFYYVYEQFTVAMMARGTKPTSRILKLKSIRSQVIRQVSSESSNHAPIPPIREASYLIRTSDLLTLNLSIVLLSHMTSLT